MPASGKLDAVQPHLQHHVSSRPQVFSRPVAQHVSIKVDTADAMHDEVPAQRGSSGSSGIEADVCGSEAASVSRPQWHH
jgi:hypothetical protein